MSIINKRIGIIGGGQLGKMMVLEAKRLGFYTAILDPDKDCPAHSISDAHIVAAFDDPAGYEALAQKADVITYEYEHIHTAVLEKLQQAGHLIYPSVSSLKIIQNKFSQKTALHNNGIPIPRFSPVSNMDDIRVLGNKENFGYPIMLKTTTGGYDGKGNALIMNEDEIESAFIKLGSGIIELMAEEFIAFEKEISIIACRGIDGGRVIYPVAENIHTNSILDTTIVPAKIGRTQMEEACRIADKVMDVFEGVGTFCIELFAGADGKIFVNEVAPRPHNSGHYTIEGCFANQFENHIRGIVGLPFGNTDLISPTVMVNLLGESNGPAKLIGLEEAYRDAKVHVHFYGKVESKTGRKMGHFTVVDADLGAAVARAEKIKNIVRIIGEPR